MATAPKTRTLTAEDGQIVFEVDMATAPKTRTLTGTRVRGCWSCCSRAAETTSWKSRSKMGLNASFQLVENVLNNYCLDSFFWETTIFWHRRMGQHFRLLSYLSAVLCTWERCLSWFCGTKIIQPFQIKGQYNLNISEEHFCYNTPSPPPVCISISPILQHTFS